MLSKVKARKRVSHKPIPQKISSNGNKKKWLTLGVIGAALLLIPRRSSRQDMPDSDSLAEKGDLEDTHIPAKNARNNSLLT